MEVTRREELFQRIAVELDRAYAKHGREQWGRHEFYGILKEEVDELWDNIKSDAPQEDVLEEAMQVAAMVFRYYETRDRYREPDGTTSTQTPFIPVTPWVQPVMPWVQPPLPWNPGTPWTAQPVNVPVVTYERCVQ